VKAVIGLVRRAVRYELRLYQSLFRWVTRRPDVPAGAMPIRYVGGVEVLLWVFILLSAVELVVFHVILPWETIRTIVDILSVWGVVWMVGLLASFKVYPHLVTDSGLRVRNGINADLIVPWDAIATVGVRERSREKSRSLQLDRDGTGTVLNVVTASRTNVELALRHPLAVRLPKGEVPVTEIRLFADDARELVSQVREYLPAGTETNR
jgi:hypothetical protein